MSTADRVRAMVAADPSRTLQSMADELGLSRERVRQICTAHGIQREKPPDKSPTCALCGYPISYGATYCRICWQTERHHAPRLTFACEQCGEKFLRREAEVRSNAKKGILTRWCSKLCMRRWASRKYGFGSPNETIAQQLRGRKKEVA